MVLQEKHKKNFFRIKLTERNVLFSATLRTNFFFRFAPRPPGWLMVDPLSVPRHNDGAAWGDSHLSIRLATSLLTRVSIF